MEDQLSLLRHSTAHLLAAAVVELYPDAKPTIGPVIENGFYYDFDLSKPISEEDLPKIEAKMQELLKSWNQVTTREISVAEAKTIFANNSYKLELIKDLAKEHQPISLYKTGNFEDLCRGGHVDNPALSLKAFKLLSIAGAYWKGNEKNKMLTRVYGTAFPTQKELDDYLQMLEDAKKRDHRKIGKELDLFSIDDYVGPGLILWHPKLSVVREEIELFWRKEHRKRGYQYIYTPHVGLSKLWETSGHLDFFKEGMYPPMSMVSKDQNEDLNYFVKPMSCPFHVRIYKSCIRSYRDLPLRWCELGTVYRYEESGVLHGLLRVRGFTQDDAHIICREDQFIEEVKKVLDFAIDINKVFGFDKLNVYLSVRDPKNKKKYVGEEKIWQLAEKTLRQVLHDQKLLFKEDLGGAKFYGPAIDLKAIDSIGREWQGTTIQLDFNLPTRFKMTYIGQDGKEHTPIMVHRTLLGSMERFMGTLIEQFAGAFPLWLSPIQVQIVPITDQNRKYGQFVLEQLLDSNIRAELDDRQETMQSKIRDAQLQKIPYMIILGEREEKAQKVAVRTREGKDLGMVSLKDFIEQILTSIESKANL